MIIVKLFYERLLNEQLGRTGKKNSTKMVG